MLYVVIFSRSSTLEKSRGGLLGLAQRFTRSSSDLGMPSVKIFRGSKNILLSLCLKIFKSIPAVEYICTALSLFEYCETIVLPAVGMGMYLV